MTWSVWLDREGPAEHPLAPSFSFLIRDFSILRYFARRFWNQTEKITILFNLHKPMFQTLISFDLR